MTVLKAQLNLFFIALGFMTRIPVPSWVDFSQAKLNQASRFFPAVGWVVGLICAFIFYLAQLIFPTEISVLISMALSLMLTGCFHEDGLTDSCDGLGGGWTSQQKLNIMKDSRIGTYGAASLWFVLTFKFSALSQLDNIMLALLVAHPISRCVATIFIHVLPYVTDSQKSKVKPLAESSDRTGLSISILIGISALLLVPNQALAILITLIIAGFILAIFFRKQVGGFTGDLLGATQQICELLVYLVLQVGHTT